MEDFEARRKKYFENIRNNPRVLNMMINGGKDDNERFKTLEVITAPTNELELELAEVLFTYTKDVISLFDIMINNQNYDEDFQNNEMIKLEIQMVNLLRNGGDVERITSKYDDPKMAARLMYDSLICPPFGNEVLYYVGIWTGFDISDEYDYIQLVSLLEQSSELIADYNSDMIIYGMEDIDEDRLKDIKEYTDEFHRLCEEGRVQSNDKPLERGLFPGNIKITFN